ncbi:hypothetical protein MPSEU_000654100 [Mayamaea pseudoterrestris]|nr:hypothetical protein MPSEU_000654100 [Mayamaea pseudoterrestris]
MIDIVLSAMLLILPFTSALAVAPTPSLPFYSLPVTSRRAFIRVGVVTLVAAPAVASAYEFVDVGGGQGSAVTQAMNIQAYETNNRLEKGGFQLETPAEQSKSLSAALADYSYEPSKSSKKEVTKSSKPTNNRVGTGASSRKE